MAEMMEQNQVVEQAVQVVENTVAPAVKSGALNNFMSKPEANYFAATALGVVAGSVAIAAAGPLFKTVKKTAKKVVKVLKEDDDKTANAQATTPEVQEPMIEEPTIEVKTTAKKK